MSDQTMAGRTVLVTGASDGIGAETARALAARGATVHVTGRSADKLRPVAEAVGTEPLIADFSRLDDVRRLAELVGERVDKLDVLMNNAGGSRAFGKDATDQQWDEAFTLNFTRHRQLTLAFLPGMQAKKWGRVIYITGKQEPDGVNGAFCAKAALTAFSKGLSREVGKQGITVNCIPPGRIMSDQIRRNYTPEYRAWQSEHEIPMGRYGEPEDLAVLAVFLASPRAGYITGTVSPVDGGLRRYQY